MNGMIPHNKPTIEQDDIRAVAETLASGFISQGKAVERFEGHFSRMHGGRHAVAVNSGTSALHLALRALNVREGSEVIIPSYVCSALLNAVRYVGAEPVFADIDPDDLNISPADIRRRLSRRTAAIIVPHMFGLPAKIREILKTGVPVIEDCAQSLGARVGGALTGTLADIAIFSFFSTKVISSCGEGGMVLAKSAKLAHAVAGLREYDEKKEYEVRYNYKMTDVAAAMGLTQLRKLSSFIAKRRSVASHYDRSLRGTALHLDRNVPGNIFFRYLIRLGNNRSHIIKLMERNKIGIKRPVYRPLHSYFNISEKSYPNTISAWKSIFSLPIFPAIAKKEVEEVISCLL